MSRILLIAIIMNVVSLFLSASAGKFNVISALALILCGLAYSLKESNENSDD